MRMFFRKAKVRPWALAFEGRVAQALLQERGLEGRSVAEQLLARQSDIEDELQTALAKALQAEVSVEIELDETTLEWCGEIEALCGPGFGAQGFMGLRHLVGSTISRVLA